MITSLLIVAGVWILILALIFAHFRLLQLEYAVHRMLDRYDNEHPADRWDNKE